MKHYETTRREEVEKTQHAADVSLVWFEKPRRFWKLEPMQLAFSLLSRSKQITYENLKRRDAAFGAEVDRWWAGKVRERPGRSTCRPTIRRRRCSRRSASAT